MTISRHTRKGFVIALIAAATYLILSRTESSAQSVVPAVGAASLRDGSSLARLVAKWPKRTSSEMVQRIRALGNSLLAGRGVLDDVELQAASQQIRPDVEFWHFENRSGDGRSKLYFTYHVKTDDLRVEDAGLIEEISPTEIDETTARGLMRDAVGRLVAAGLIRAEDFDPAGASLAWRKVGAGRRDESVVDKILEYRFSLLRQINGIPFANAGIRVGVHRSGTVSSLRVGGAEISSVRQAGVEVAADTRGGVFSRKASRTDVARRFGLEYPNTKIWTQGLMYVMRDDVEEDVIEPKEHYLFSRVIEHSDGKRAFAPAERVSYSTAEIGSPAIVHSRLVSAPLRAPDQR